MLSSDSSVTTDNQEVEIKLRIDGDVDAMRQRLVSAGFQVSKQRVFESNTMFDTANHKMRENSELLRLRRVGGACILTYKGPPQAGKHKSREEIETEVSDQSKMELILSRLGWEPVFRYEKFRTEFQSGPEGTVTLDETPIGLFMELEGPPAWIDEVAGRLGFSEPQYITKSYGSLYLEYCHERGLTPSNMVFG